MPKLFDHQEQFLTQRIDKTALVWSCGTGKTRAALEWSKQKPTQRLLIICPKALKTNWQREAQRWGAKAYVLTKEEFRRDVKRLPRYGQVIVDECFPAGTKVLTPFGYKNIESIKKGEAVISAVGPDVVISTSKRVARSLVEIAFYGRKVRVTPNHRFFTLRGWVKASQLSTHDVLLHYGFCTDIIEGHGEIYLQKLREGFASFGLSGLPQRQKKDLYAGISTPGLLRRQLSDEVYLEDQEKADVESVDHHRKPQKKLDSDEGKEPDEKSHLEREGASIADYDRPYDSSSRWKWSTNAAPSKTALGRLGRWVERRIRGTHSFKAPWNRLSNLLQNRHRQSTEYDRYRSRRQQSQHFAGPDQGQKEGSFFRGYRVESITLQKSESVVVYNLGVKRHPSYVVGDVLVHNCHNGFLTPNFKSLLSKALRWYLLKHGIERILLLSATVYTSSPWNIYNLSVYLCLGWDRKRFEQTFFNYVRMGPRMIPVARKGSEKRLAKIVKQIASVVDINDVMDVPLQNHLEPEYFALTDLQIRLIKESYDPLPIVRYTAEHEIEQGILLGNEFRAPRSFKADKNDRILDLVAENPKVAIVARYNAQIDALAILLNNYSPFIIRGGTPNRDAVCLAAERAEKAVVIIQADCAEGYQLPSFGLCLFASQSYSYTKWEQICGRFLRMDKPSRTTFVYLLTEDDSIDQAVYDAVKRKEDFKIELFRKDEKTRTKV